MFKKNVLAQNLKVVFDKNRLSKEAVLLNCEKDSLLGQTVLVKGHFQILNGDILLYTLYILFFICVRNSITKVYWSSCDNLTNFRINKIYQMMTSTPTNLDMAITEKMIATPYNNPLHIDFAQFDVILESCWTTFCFHVYAQKSLFVRLLSCQACPWH